MIHIFLFYLFFHFLNRNFLSALIILLAFFGFYHIGHSRFVLYLNSRNVVLFSNRLLKHLNYLHFLDRWKHFFVYHIFLNLKDNRSLRALLELKFGQVWVLELLLYLGHIELIIRAFLLGIFANFRCFVQRMFRSILLMFYSNSF